MSRPEHPGVPLPSSCIRDLRMRQDLYDRDAEAYERREMEVKEQQHREMEELYRSQKIEEERLHSEQESDLPF